MRKPYISIALALTLVGISLPSAIAVYNGTPAVEGIAVQVYTSDSSCSGVIWQPTIVITAAHCVFQSSGALKNSISVRGLVNKDWVTSEVAGVRAPINYAGATGNSIYSGQSESDIAFLILKSKIWDSPLFPNLRLATNADWDKFKASYTGLEIHGFGYLDNSGTLATAPVSGFFSVQPNLSSGIKDWAVMQSTKSSVCQGDSGGPVIYYREAEKALILVGIVVGGTGPDKCGSFQFGLYTATMTLISSFNSLASSAEITESKYRTGKDAVDEISKMIDTYDANLVNFDNYLPNLSTTAQKKIKSNSNLKNLNKQLDLLKNQYDSYLASLDASMEFNKINSAVIEANTPAVGLNWSDKSSKTLSLLDSYFQKFTKYLPSYQCITSTQIKDIQSNGKCPRGYIKVSIEKPF